MARTYIIAEMSANHCGDLAVAREIVYAAKAAGADAIKLQTYTADTITINCSSEYFQTRADGLWAGRTLYDLYREAYTPWEWHEELKCCADALGLDFFSTPFDRTAVDFLEALGVPMYKIASFEAIDYELIKYTAGKGKPMIISVGISSPEEIQEAIDACHAVGNRDITLLKCTSAYPARLDEMNLATIRDMQERYGSQGVRIGLSDHSLSIEPAVAAVALGACVVEKHLALDRKLGGVDSGFSLNKEEFAQMVQAVRRTEQLMGTVDYESGLRNRRSARSLFAVRNIAAGECFTPENVRSIRPSHGLHPRYYKRILGMCAARDIPFGTPLSSDCVAAEPGFFTPSFL